MPSKKRWLVELREIWHQKVAVVAATQKEAQDMAQEGNCVVIDNACEYVSSYDNDPVSECREAHPSEIEDYGPHFWSDQEEHEDAEQGGEPHDDED